VKDVCYNPPGHANGSDSSYLSQAG